MPTVSLHAGGRRPRRQGGPPRHAGRHEGAGPVPTGGRTGHQPPRRDRDRRSPHPDELASPVTSERIVQWLELGRASVERGPEHGIGVHQAERPPCAASAPQAPQPPRTPCPAPSSSRSHITACRATAECHPRRWRPEQGRAGGGRCSASDRRHCGTAGGGAGRLVYSQNHWPAPRGGADPEVFARGML
jgi:hypothetical protein